MSQSVTVQPGFASDPLVVGPFSIVSVTPTSSCAVVYTEDDLAAINNGTATWAAWPSGAVTAYTQNMANAQMFVRMSANTAAATITISDPNPRQFEVDPSPWVGVTAGSQTFSSTVTFNGSIVGPLLVNDGSAGAPSYSYSSDGTTGLYFAATGVFISVGGTRRGIIDGTGIAVDAGHSYRFSNDLFLERDAANVLGQRNAGSAQTFRVYGSYAASTTFAALMHDGTNAVVSTQGGGLQLSASTMGFYGVSVTTQPNVSSVIATTAITSVAPFGFSSSAMAQDAVDAIRRIQQALKALGLSA